MQVPTVKNGARSRIHHRASATAWFQRGPESLARFQPWLLRNVGVRDCVDLPRTPAQTSKAGVLLSGVGASIRDTVKANKPSSFLLLFIGGLLLEILKPLESSSLEYYNLSGKYPSVVPFRSKMRKSAEVRFSTNPSIKLVTIMTKQICLFLYPLRRWKCCLCSGAHPYLRVP